MSGAGFCIANAIARQSPRSRRDRRAIYRKPYQASPAVGRRPRCQRRRVRRATARHAEPSHDRSLPPDRRCSRRGRRSRSGLRLLARSRPDPRSRRPRRGVPSVRPRTGEVPGRGVRMRGRRPAIAPRRDRFVEAPSASTCTDESSRIFRGKGRIAPGRFGAGISGSVQAPESLVGVAGFEPATPTSRTGACADGGVSTMPPSAAQGGFSRHLSSRPKRPRHPYMFGRCLVGSRYGLDPVARSRPRRWASSSSSSTRASRSHFGT